MADRPSPERLAEIRRIVGEPEMSAPTVIPTPFAWNLIAEIDARADVAPLREAFRAISGDGVDTVTPDLLIGSAVMAVRGLDSLRDQLARALMQCDDAERAAAVYKRMADELRAKLARTAQTLAYAMEDSSRDVRAAVLTVLADIDPDDTLVIEVDEDTDTAALHADGTDAAAEAERLGRLQRAALGTAETTPEGEK